MENQVKTPSTLFYYPKSRQRYTVCGMINQDGKSINIGFAQCRKDEVFLKATGREIALTMANEKPYKVIPIDGGTFVQTFLAHARKLFPDKFVAVFTAKHVVKGKKVRDSVNTSILLK